MKRPILKRLVYYYDQSRDDRLSVTTAIHETCPNIETLELRTPPNTCPYGSAGTVFTTKSGEFPHLRTLTLENFDFPLTAPALPASGFVLPALERVTFCNVRSSFALDSGAPTVGACLANTNVAHVCFEGRLNISAEWLKRFLRPFMDRECGPLALLEACGRLPVSHRYESYYGSNDSEQVFAEFQRVFGKATNNIMQLFVKSVYLDFDGLGKVVDGVSGHPSRTVPMSDYHTYT